MFVSVFLVDPLGVVPTNLKMSTMSVLQTYFNAVTASNNNADTVTVTWPGGMPFVANTDMIVYYLDFGHTLATQKFGEVTSGAAGLPFLDSSGQTILPPVTTMSEVYMTNFDPTVLANVTFHELMHNKLQLGDSMHSMDGLRKGAPQGGLGPTDTISSGNIADMAPVISAPVPQFVAGFGVLMTAAASQIARDPTWDSALH
jgi:hypothetical protein